MFLSKFVEKWSCGVKLCMNSCSLVVVIDLVHVVVGFMLWVLMKVLLWLNCGDFAIFGENGLIMKKFDFDDVEWVKEDC